MTNLVEILVRAKDLTGPGLAAVNAKVEATGKGMKVLHKTAALAALGFAAFGVEAVKSASKFDSEMTLLQTQAGVSADKIGGLKKGVLDLAGKVGQDPDSLAEALYHVESNFESMGITSAKALELTKVAAEGATVGHAKLVDVTNALTAAVAANIPGVQNLDQAMGVLNATVGVGDMKMQDLAGAFGGGMIATVKGFGLNIKDVGAALAVFGDHNIRGAVAGTQLRMAVQALAKPVATGADALQRMGLQTDTLAKDMQKGGLKLALEDLVAHMKAAGISSVEQGQIITEAFGKKAGSGLNVLVGSFDRLETKYTALDAGAKNFAQSWADTKKTTAFQLKQIETGFEALTISIGEKLLPVVQKTLSFLSQHRAAATGTAEAMLGLAAAAVAVSVGLKAVAAAKVVWAGITTGAALAKGALETAALKAMYMRDAFVAAGGGARGAGAALGAMSTKLKLGVGIGAVAALTYGLHKLFTESDKTTVSLDDFTRQLEKATTTGRLTSPMVQELSRDMAGQTNAANLSAESIDKLKKAWGKDPFKSAAAARDLKEFGQALGDIAKNRGPEQATAALKLLNKQGISIPTKYLKDYNNALADTKIQSDITAQSMGKYGQTAVQVQAQLKAQQDQVDGLVQSYQALDDIFLGMFDAETAQYQAISDATKALKENGRTLSLNSDAGRKNRDALSGIAAATDKVVAADLKNSASQKTVAADYQRGYNNIVKLAEGMGYTKSQASNLAKQMLHIPKDIQSKIKLLGVASAKKQLAALTAPETKIITVSTKFGKGYQLSHEGGGYAHGGVIGAASGGPRSRLTLVGEQGPELVSLAAGSTVHSNPDSRRMLAAAGGSGAPGGVLQVNLNVDGRTLARVMLDPQRELIRELGGNVQAVLGRRS